MRSIVAVELVDEHGNGPARVVLRDFRRTYEPAYETYTLTPAYVDGVIAFVVVHDASTGKEWGRFGTDLEALQGLLENRRGGGAIDHRDLRPEKGAGVTAPPIGVPLTVFAAPGERSWGHGFDWAAAAIEHRIRHRRGERGSMARAVAEELATLWTAIQRFPEAEAAKAEEVPADVIDRAADAFLGPAPTAIWLVRTTGNDCFVFAADEADARAIVEERERVTAAAFGHTPLQVIDAEEVPIDKAERVSVPGSTSTPDSCFGGVGRVARVLADEFREDPRRRFVVALHVHSWTGGTR